MKKLLYLLLPLSFLLIHSSPAQDHLDGIAAVVEGEAITFSAVKQELERFRTSNPKVFAEQQKNLGRMGLLRQTTKRLVEDELLYAEVAQRKIKLPKDFVDRRMQGLVNDKFGGDWDKFSEALLNAGQSLKEYREEMGKRIAAELLVDELVRRNVTVTSQEVLDFYSRHSDQFHVPARIRLSLIFLARNKKQTDKDLSERMSAIRKRLANGELFADIAKELSADSTAEYGGDLGWQPLSGLSKLYRNAVSNIKAGQLAPVIHEPAGFHLLKVVDREDEHQVPLDETVRRQIESRLRAERTDVKYKEFIAELREKFYVKNFVEANLPDKKN